MRAAVTQGQITERQRPALLRSACFQMGIPEKGERPAWFLAAGTQSSCKASPCELSATQ